MNLAAVDPARAAVAAKSVDSEIRGCVNRRNRVVPKRNGPG